MHWVSFLAIALTAVYAGAVAAIPSNSNGRSSSSNNGYGGQGGGSGGSGGSVERGESGGIEIRLTFDGEPWELPQMARDAITSIYIRCLGGQPEVSYLSDVLRRIPLLEITLHSFSHPTIPLRRKLDMRIP